MATRLFKRDGRCWFERAGAWRGGDGFAFDFDDLFRSPDPMAMVAGGWERAEPRPAPEPGTPWDPPIGTRQEVWAAGVTYYRSRTARMEESEQAGGERFYEMVYEADRPELFFKATARRVRGHGQPVGVRADSTWDVPEPELALAVGASGRVFGYTIGNDVSSRSIEGVNPLYLPQAKVFTGSCALGPCLLVPENPLPSATAIRLAVVRGESTVFEGATSLDQMKRSADELADWLFRCNDFPDGAVLLTGTGIVPDPPFTLRRGDTVAIGIDGIGALTNTVA